MHSRGYQFISREDLNLGPSSGTATYILENTDEGQGGAASNIYFTDPPASTYNGNYQADKGRSTLDQRQRLVVSGILTPPKMNFGSKYVNMAAHGWQLSLIETAASPQYFDPILIVSSGLNGAGLASGTTITGM